MLFLLSYSYTALGQGRIITYNLDTVDVISAKPLSNEIYQLEVEASQRNRKKYYLGKGRSGSREIGSLIINDELVKLAYVDVYFNIIEVDTTFLKVSIYKRNSSMTFLTSQEVIITRQNTHSTVRVYLEDEILINSNFVVSIKATYPEPEDYSRRVGIPVLTVANKGFHFLHDRWFRHYIYPYLKVGVLKYKTTE